MPEGDTILRTATVLRGWLAGREITAARTTSARAAQVATLVADRVEVVEARAKHVLIRFRSGRVLHTHMQMSGSWHVYTLGERWHRSAAQARLVLEAGERVAVCFNAPVIELLAAGDERAHPVLRALGPDVLAPAGGPDLGEVWRRAAQRPDDTEIGDLLLDQRIVSGIGNIWRCETLFLAGANPRRLLGSIDEETLTRMVETAAHLMAASAHPGGSGRRDVGLGLDRVGSGRYWVYRRSGRPCRRCATPVVAGRVGVSARTAYWCARCQPAA